ncbi:class I SAM-dependent methyltransferase [Paraflavitalea pollutisoli]|uniref:class I SAM-dependent methyltransferase n=1 Tax=Paraflavitalea pollutisoli TaxID=3034143 RepID=UPI0023ED4B4C|nr:class I SAM-dependent methyltransferase [Paraflavitalea sp. H1-2-19X]
MNKMAAFDALAAGYDLGFGQSLTGQAQRQVARRWLLQFLAGKGSLRILEINCGTGDDAWWLASLGHQVVATDQSAAMIDAANAKGPQHNDVVAPQFLTCAFHELGSLQDHVPFDLVFSNFAGLNCITPPQLHQLGKTFQALLQPEGHLALVLFGKYCWWESCYYLLKGHWRQAGRRWTQRPQLARLTDTVQQSISYYSVRQFSRRLPTFRLLTAKPVGLFIPPSYLEPAMRKHPRLFHLLVWLDTKSQPLPLLSALADHTYVLLKKNVP